MPSISLTGNDSIIWTDADNPGGIPLTDLADGDVMTIAWGADISAAKVGKNGNVLSARNAEGDLAEITIRTLRGSDDDIMLNAVEAAYLADPPSFITPQIAAIKRIGDGDGFVTNDEYDLSFITPKKHTEMKENVSGDTEQAVAIHVFFGVCVPNNSPRSIG